MTKTIFSAVIAATVWASALADAMKHVDSLIGTEGSGSQYGGMMPCAGVPFGSFQMVPMTRLNRVGQLSFNAADDTLIGYILTRQPAIWMGDWGEVRIPIEPAKIERADDRPHLGRVTAGGRTFKYTAEAYLLGAERLFENAPKVEFEEVVVENGTQGTGGTEGTGTAISIAVTVRDGEEAVKCAAEKVKSLFKATSDLGDWDGAAKLEPEVSIEATDDPTTMRFKVIPGDGTESKAFLRIRK